LGAACVQEQREVDLEEGLELADMVDVSRKRREMSRDGSSGGLEVMGADNLVPEKVGLDG